MSLSHCRLFVFLEVVKVGFEGFFLFSRRRRRGGGGGGLPLRMDVQRKFGDTILVERRMKKTMMVVFFLAPFGFSRHCAVCVCVCGAFCQFQAQ